MKNYYALLFSLLPFTLSAQRVALIGLNNANFSGNRDGYAFVALEDIPAGDKFFFTEEDYDAANNNWISPLVGEQVVEWTAGSAGLSRGCVVVIHELSQNTGAVVASSAGCDPGTVTASYESFSIGTNDPLYVFESTGNGSAEAILAGLSTIHGVMWIDDAPFDSNDDPRGDYPDAVVVNVSVGSGAAQYSPTSRGIMVTLADLTNSANYETTGSDSPFDPLDHTLFTNIVQAGPRCPGIGELMIDNSSVCPDSLFSLTANGLTNMAASDNNDQDYGIEFVVFSEFDVDPYTASGGVSLGEVSFAELDDANTTALLADISFAQPGSYQIFARLSPVPDDLSCRPFQSAFLNVSEVPVPIIVDFGALSHVCVDAGVLTINVNVPPVGGVYSGPGVTDNGDGVSFDFDPAAVGVGVTSTIVYVNEETSICGSFVSGNITVTEPLEVSFSLDLTGLTTASGLQTDLDGGLPVAMGSDSGTYTGPGVIDNGNGTFHFDPAAAGVGLHQLTYTFLGVNGCHGSANVTVEVLEAPLPGEECENAINISSLFGGALNEAQVSGVQDNTDYDPDNDPGFGYECFFEGTLDHTIWYTFTGDGGHYGIRSILCEATNPIVNGDTQFALYSGDCSVPVAVACNDDEDFDNDLFTSYLEVMTEVGADYHLMVDGFAQPGNYVAIGTFCLEVTRLGTVNADDIYETRPYRIYPNPTHDWVYLQGPQAERIEIRNVAGQLLMRQNANTGSIDLRELAAGLYWISTFYADGVVTARVVKH